jgi:hypothetical protein
MLNALEEVPVNLTKPRIVTVFGRPDLQIAFARTCLFLVLPKRDRIVWQWLTLRAEERANTREIAQAEIAAEMQGIVFASAFRSRSTRRHPRDLTAKVKSEDRFF